LCVCLKYNLFEIRVDNLMNYGDRQTNKSYKKVAQIMRHHKAARSLSVHVNLE